MNSADLPGAQAHQHDCLDHVGIQEGTDKSSLMGDLLRHYESALAHLRFRSFNIIEIGVFCGASLRTWERYFQHARIIGIDIDPDCLRHQTHRSSVFVGSQSDVAFLRQVADAYPPTVVIDDGSHSPSDITSSFEVLFPALMPGGVYAVEDMHFHIRVSERNLHSIDHTSIEQYFMNIAKHRMGDSYHLLNIEDDSIHCIVGEIDKIEFIQRAVLIHKRARWNAEATLSTAYPHLVRSGDWMNWLNFWNKLRETGSSADDAKAALAQSVRLNTNAKDAYLKIGRQFARLGDYLGALAMLQTALEIAVSEGRDTTALSDEISALRESQCQTAAARSAGGSPGPFAGSES
jgi:hypothetical protein